MSERSDEENPPQAGVYKFRRVEASPIRVPVISGTRDKILIISEVVPKHFVPLPLIFEFIYVHWWFEGLWSDFRPR